MTALATEIPVVLRVTSVLSRGKTGGVIFAGVTDTQERYVAVCDYTVFRDSSLVDKGQSWQIVGRAERRGDNLQIKAKTATMVRPAGLNLIAWIANSPLCHGVGEVKARRLYERFGTDLLPIIKAKNIALLSEVVSEQSAGAMCHAFEQHNVAGALAWLDGLGVQRRIGERIVAFFGADAQAKIEENPYRLTSFAESWRVVDDLARHRFGVLPDDRFRLEAGLDEALYSAIGGGHTCVPLQLLPATLKSLLGSTELASMAIRSNSPNVLVTGDIAQARGPYLIEQYVADRLRAIAAGEDGGQQSLLAGDALLEDDLEACIEKYEAANGFSLMSEQRAAVKTSVTHRLSLILGGAGTGKTTVLKALYHALEVSQPAVAIYQLALAGRAAQRMSEATGRESMTIAAFLNKVDSGQLSHDSVVVIDEVSMVDVILMYRLLHHLPIGVRLVLVGDPSQLPPIGPGLVLHALVGHAAIPQTELKVTKRQSSSTGIPAVASAIRSHEIPHFTKYEGKGPGVSFIACSDREIEDRTVEIYGDLGGPTGEVQILSVTRNGIGGVRNLNESLHQVFQSAAEMVWCYDAELGVVGARTLDKVAIRVGDLVMYTKNDYALGLRNGSLGVVLRALPVVDAESTCCVCEFDGVAYELKTTHVYALAHSYSITVHKSQGSQFDRVIIPIRKSRLLDQTLVYTAITRAIQQVVIVGDLQAVQAAIAAPATAARRRVRLPEMLLATPTP